MEIDIFANVGTDGHGQTLKILIFIDLIDLVGSGLEPDANLWSGSSVNCTAIGARQNLGSSDVPRQRLASANLEYATNIYPKT